MKLVVALDRETKEANLDLAHKLAGMPVWLKVGLRTYIRDGKPFLEALKHIDRNVKIFLDLKLYDIPNTMADAAEEIAKLGIDMFNIHASAGEAAMQAVGQRLKRFEKKPLVLAVTALTSFDTKSFGNVYGASIASKVSEWAEQSYRNGLDGVVCSVWESRALKELTGNDFLTLTPGIRPFGEGSDDQKRVADIEAAKEHSVDFVVVGRPIYRAKDPARKVEEILTAIGRD